MTCLLVWLTAGSLAAVSAPGPATLDSLVSLAGGVGAWLGLAWLTGSFFVCVLAAVPGVFGRVCAGVADRVTPALVRKAAGAALGLAVGAGVTFPASAMAAGPASVVTAAAVPDAFTLRPVATPAPAAHAAATAAPAAGPVAAEQPKIDGPALPDLDRPTAARAATPAWTPKPSVRPQLARSSAPMVTGAVRPRLAVTDTLVVRRGDTLWDIAARHLGADASAGEIAEAWPRWHVANRDVIGPDPHRLLPGQQLVPPADR